MTTQAPVGTSTGGKPINLSQLQSELAAAGVAVGNGLGLTNDQVYPYDGQGQATDFPAAEEPTVEQVIAAHVAMRDKTDEEYSAEFQDPNTTIARKQQIRDIMDGLLPREQVPVDPSVPQAGPVSAPVPQNVQSAVNAISKADTTEALRAGMVAWLGAQFGEVPMS
jgi:hypothetical protein